MTVGPAAAQSRAANVPVVAVVGVGLIGGSFAAALKAAGAAGRILGVGPRRATLDRAHSLGLIDEVVSLDHALGRADLIMLAAPVGATAELLTAMRSGLRPQTAVTDAGSTKADVVQAARQTLRDKVAQFVPGHPIAGAEHTGPDAAHAGLYQGRTVVLTPLAETDAAMVARVRRAWQMCGAHVRTMTAETHDQVLASVSHVPHLLASVYMHQVATAQDADCRLALAGSGFRDFTRIAAGSSEVWRDIFLANRQAVLDELQVVRRDLDRAEQTLREGDARGLQDFLERAAVARRFWDARQPDRS